MKHIHKWSTYLSRFQTIVLVAALMPLLVTTNYCSSSPTEVGSPQPAAGDDIALEGQLLLADGSPAPDASVTVQSHPEYTTTTDVNGNFQFMDMDPGEYILYGETNLGGTLGNKPSPTRDINPNIRSAQFRNVLVLADQSNTLVSDTRLTVPGSISGTIGLINNPQNVELVGIDIYIPGTSFAAKSDASGNFVLSNVPAGLYTVRFEKDGLSAFEIGDVIVASGKDTNLNNVNLSLSIGPSGRILSLNKQAIHQINGEDKIVVTANTVTVNLAYDSSAVLMKTAHESSFINIDWIPVNNQHSFSSASNPSANNHFQSDGQKQIYVKFSDLNGQESSIYRLDFIIDRDAPSLDSFSIMYGTSDVKSNVASMHYTVAASDTGSGVKEMMLSRNAMFTDTTGWITYDPDYLGFALDSGSGLKIAYAKVRDYSGNESGILSDTINATLFTRVNNFIDTLTLDFAPYRFDDSLNFNGDFTIEAGVSLTHDGVGTTPITVAGNLIIEGETGNEVTITTSSGFIQSISVLDENGTNETSIEHLNVPTGTAVTQDFLILPGGSINGMNYDVATGSQINSDIKHTGNYALSVTNSNFISTRKCIEAAGGVDQLSITYNVFTCEVALYQDNATGASLRFNTIYNNPTTTSDRYVDVRAGDAIIEYNHFAEPSNFEDVFASGSASLLVNHNNFADGATHLIVFDFASITSVQSYFAGGLLESVNGSGSIDDDSFAGGSWPTVAGPGCVGADC